MRVDWCVSSWFRIKNTHSLTENKSGIGHRKPRRRTRRPTTTCPDAQSPPLADTLGVPPSAGARLSPDAQSRYHKHTLIGRRRTVRLGLDTSAGVDAGQKRTTRTSDTQTHTSSQDTQPAGLPHIPSKRTNGTTPLRATPGPPVRCRCRPPQHLRCQGHKQQQ